MKKSTTIFDFFKRKVSNDLEANSSGATLPTTNVEENPDVSIEKNLDSPIEKNLDEPVEENLALLTPSPGSVPAPIGYILLLRANIGTSSECIPKNHPEN